MGADRHQTRGRSNVASPQQPPKIVPILLPPAAGRGQSPHNSNNNSFGGKAFAILAFLCQAADVVLHV